MTGETNSVSSNWVMNVQQNSLFNTHIENKVIITVHLNGDDEDLNILRSNHSELPWQEFLQEVKEEYSSQVGNPVYEFYDDASGALIMVNPDKVSYIVFSNTYVTYTPQNADE